MSFESRIILVLQQIGLDMKQALQGSSVSVIGVFGVSNAQSVNSTVYTKIDLNTEDFKDSGITHDNAVNPSRIQVDVAGRYEIKGFISIDGTQSNYRYGGETAISINGSTERNGITSGYIRSSTGHNECSLNVLDMVDLSAGDYIEISVRRITSTSGNAVTTPDKCKIIIEKK